MLKTRQLLLLLLVVSLLALSSTGNADILTGCLKPNGKFGNFAIGGTPAEPCRPGQTQVSLGEKGDKGDKGDTGDPGSGGGTTTMLEFKGYSGGTVNGGVGYVGLMDECVKSLGADARPCTTEEFIKSRNISTPSVDGAWINPVISAAANTNGLVFDYSGLTGVPGAVSTSNNNWDCHRWTIADNTGKFGFVVTSGGSIYYARCDTPRAVTCCAPP